MKKITIYDPAMCCSSGVCGPEVDPTLVRVSGMLSQMSGLGVKVERFNLAQQPISFAQNREVREILEKDGTQALPLTFIDEVLEIKGRYPDESERAAWIERARPGARDIA
ncbi:MAG: arsenite efflux transporter metallochaperone ArsD [Opitutales bacterium]|nr:arsenite efflux transporter metallochaperone ArsD [Opitutales bacterium]